MKRNLKQKGFSLVEVMLSVALFVLILTAANGAFWYSQENNAIAGNRNRANLLADEALEALRNIRDNDFASLSDGTYRLDNSNGYWQLLSGTETIGIFSRQISISSVSADVKEVSADITWAQNLQRTGSLSVPTYLSNWQETTAVVISTCNEHCASLNYQVGTCKKKISQCKGSNVYESGGDTYCTGNRSYCCCSP